MVVSDYEPDIVNQIGGLLVVDGFITNDTILDTIVYSGMQGCWMSLRKGVDNGCECFC